MKLLDLVDPKCVVANLAAREKSGVFRGLTQTLVDAGILPASDLDRTIKLILARERSRGTTGFGKGVALPHVKLDGLGRVVAAVGRSENGVDYDSHDGQPVFGVFLVLSPSSPAESHLKAMELVYRHLLLEKFRKFLRQANTPEKIMELLQEADERAFT